MTKGGHLKTKNIAIEVVNIDDAIADNAVRTTIKLLSTIIPLKVDSLLIEPHDDVRGVWARINLDRPQDASASFEKYVASAIKALINMNIHNITSAVVHVRIDEIEGEM
jgi:hypothetical protein